MAPPLEKSKIVRFAKITADNGDNTDGERKRPASERNVRHLHDNDDESNDDNAATRRPKRKRSRPNEDELDDVDEWNPQLDGGEDERELNSLGVISSEKELMEAKRLRRLKRSKQSLSAEDDEEALEATRIDNRTSLAAEGIEIEPFHMENERNDGTGYFDGETYVFRKRGLDEEPDAWLESLSNANDGGEEAEEAAIGVRKSAIKDDENEDEEKMDSWTEEDLYAKILPLVSDTETVMEAIIRYGNLLKRKHPLKYGLKQKGASSKNKCDFDATNSSQNMAQSALNDLTEASSALLLKGKVDIYQKTRRNIEELLPTVKDIHYHSTQLDSSDRNAPQSNLTCKEKALTKWEYEGSDDNQIHGPFSSEQMLGWIQAGYFIGQSAVRVRSVTPNNVAAKEKSIQEDLLSDLMDDEDEKATSDQKTVNSQEVVYGDWIMSDEIDFKLYL